MKWVCETSTVSEKSQIGACKIVTLQKFSVESGTSMHTIQENALFSGKKIHNHTRCVDNSLVQIWKVNFGHKINFLFRLWGQGFKVCSRFWSWCSGKILKLKFGHYFAADAWLWLWSSILVEALKLGLVKIFKFQVLWKCWCLVDILKLVLGRDSEDVWSRFV